MVQEYKKIGATTDGYRGERAILKERVIEGLSKPTFEDIRLQLDVNTPQTIYLTDSNFGEGFYILLPDATTLWPNWKITVINHSSHTCNIYYYTSNLNQLNLFKEVTSGNMVTAILLDNNQNTDSVGTWTNLRTTEQTSADLLYRYTSNILDTTTITWNELKQEDSDDTPGQQIRVSLGSLLAGTALRSIYIKTSEVFGVDSGNTLTLSVDIGTENDQDHFIADYDLTTAVSDTNFTKDLFEEILSTSSPTPIYATFKGTGLINLVSGSVSITLEKPKLIDPTVLKNPIVQTSLPIGVIMNYAFNDVPEGYWRLDGTMLPNAAVAIPEFVQKLNQVNNSLTGEKLIVTESYWNQLNNTYGSCGKFCWVGNSLRFPKINNFIQGLTDLTKLGLLTAAALPDPNLNHYHVFGYNTSNNSGTFTATGDNRTAAMPPYSGSRNWNGSGGGGGYNGNISYYTGNMVTSYPVSTGGGYLPPYGLSNTVQPESIKYPYIISIYNKIQNAASIDLAEIIQDSVYKANISLNNLSDEGVNYLNTSITNRSKLSVFPNWYIREGRAANVEYTADRYGYVHFNFEYRTTSYCEFYLNGTLTGRYRTWEDKYGSSCSIDQLYPVRPGDVYQLNMTGTIWYGVLEFIPAQI